MRTSALPGGWGQEARRCPSLAFKPGAFDFERGREATFPASPSTLLCRDKKRKLMGLYVLDFQKTDRTKLVLAGGKGANLGEPLRPALTPKYHPRPDSCCLLLP